MTTLAEQAKERDDHTCVKCGVTRSKTGLHAHHIVPSLFDGSDSLENLATLCAHCHRYAPEDRLAASSYEEAFEIYISTGCRPEIDLAYFGATALADSEMEEPDGMLDAFSQALMWVREFNDNQREPTDPEMYWLVLASVVNYAGIDELERYEPEQSAAEKSRGPT